MLVLVSVLVLVLVSVSVSVSGLGLELGSGVRVRVHLREEGDQREVHAVSDEEHAHLRHIGLQPWGA